MRWLAAFALIAALGCATTGPGDCLDEVTMAEDLARIRGVYVGWCGKILSDRGFDFKDKRSANAVALCVENLVRQSSPPPSY